MSEKDFRKNHSLPLLSNCANCCNCKIKSEDKIQFELYCTEVTENVEPNEVCESWGGES